jgi:hypothetical protein
MSKKPVLTCIASSLFLSACGGGGGDGSTSSPPPPPPEPTNAGGIWGGTASSDGQTIDLAGVVTEDGEGRFVAENGIQYVFDEVKGVGGDVELDFIAIVPSGGTFQDGSTVTTGTLTGTVAERSSLSGDYSLATGETGTVSMTYDALYERDSSLDKLTGNWDEEFGVVTFDPDGSFFEQDSFGCVYDGQASIVDPDFNVYALTMTVSSCGAGVDGDYSGLGIMTDTSSTDDTFIVQMNSQEWIFTTTLSRL